MQQKKEVACNVEKGCPLSLYHHKTCCCTEHPVCHIICYIDYGISIKLLVSSIKKTRTNNSRKKSVILCTVELQHRLLYSNFLTCLRMDNKECAGCNSILLCNSKTPLANPQARKATGYAGSLSLYFAFFLSHTHKHMHSNSTIIC